MEGNLVTIQRIGHVAVTWNDCIIIWGGNGMDGRCCDPQEVLIHCEGRWKSKKTTGNLAVPTGFSSNQTAEVLGDKMYVFGGQPYGNVIDGAHGEDPFQNEMSVLDLESWCWSKVKPEGSSPMRCVHQTSWVHNNKIYVFGGGFATPTSLGIETEVNYPNGIQVDEGVTFSATNQLFCYDMTKNCFEWPCIKVEGNIQTSRAGHTSFINGKAVFIFGGYSNGTAMVNDLLILDISRMIIRQVHESSTDSGLPGKRGFHSMTKITSDKAVLYGGNGPNGLAKDCWILDIKKALLGEFAEASSLWIRGGAKDLPKRVNHTAIIEPKSRGIYILGGRSGGCGFKPQMSDKILVMTFSPPPLELLAMEQAIKEYDSENPKLNEFLPKDHEMRKTLEARRQTSRMEKKLHISW